MFTRLQPVNRIILSAGHGGYKDESFDPEAAFGNPAENTEAKQIISLLVMKLTAAGFTAIATPDYGQMRTIKYINTHYNINTDLALEIHKNSRHYNEASMHRRAGIYYHPDAYGCKEIAEEMLRAYKAAGAHPGSWALPDTESPHKRLAWIRQPKMLSYIIECAFLQGKLSEGEDQFYAEMIATSLISCLRKAKERSEDDTQRSLVQSPWSVDSP